MRGGVLLCILATASSLRVAPSRGAVALRRAHVVAAIADESDEERRKRLEAAGREAAEEAKYLDGAADDGGLSAEFAKRLSAEGGATMFKAKTAVNEAGESAEQVAMKAKMAGEDAVDAVSGVARGLTEQQKNIGKIVIGLILFQILIGAIGSAFGGGQTYSV